MAVAYHTHSFDVPAATDNEAAAGTSREAFVVPANLPPLLDLKQPLSSALTSIAGLTTSADQMIYATAADAYATTALTAYGRSIVGSIDASALLNLLGAGTTGTALFQDETAADARTTLELGSLATLSTISNTNWSGADLAIENGGTGASTASAARTALGLGTAATADSTAFATAAQGEAADTAVQPGDGEAVPIGGTTGQVLAKASATDGDTFWTIAGQGDIISTNNGSDFADPAQTLINLSGQRAPYASRAAAQAATVPASVETLYLIHRGELLAYVRKVGGTALTTADGAEWTPAGRATINHYGPVADGVTEDDLVFEAAVADIPLGETREIHVQAGQYKATNIANNGRSPVWLMAPDATFTDGFSAALGVSPSRREYWTGRQKTIAVNGSKETFDTVGDYYSITNVGGEDGVGYGRRLTYRSNAYPGVSGDSFDIADGRVGVWDRTAGQAGGSGLVDWVVAISPETAGESPGWYTFCVEYNIVNRASAYTQAYAKRSEAAVNHGHGTIGLQVVPEASNFTEGGDTYDPLAGVVFGPSGGNKSSDGKPARFWSSILGEANGIVGEGYAIQWSGNDNGAVPADDPDGFLKLNDRWETAFDLSNATLVESIARLPGSKAFKYTDTEYFGQSSVGETGFWAEGGNIRIDVLGRAIIAPAAAIVLAPTSGAVESRNNIVPTGGSLHPSFVFPSYAAADIANAAHAINTTQKLIGKTVRDSTNKRLMVADGTAATSTWTSADGGTTVTPV